MMRWAIQSNPRLQNGSERLIQKLKRKRNGRDWKCRMTENRLYNPGSNSDCDSVACLHKLESDELLCLSPYLFPSLPLYTAPVFIVVQATFSSRHIRTTALAQCTCTIRTVGSHPIVSRASCSRQPFTLFRGCHQVSKDREAHHSTSNGNS